MGILVVMLLQLVAVFAAAPKIETFKLQFVLPSELQISWKVTDDDGLSRLELYQDGAQLYKEDLTGSVHASLFQVPEDNKTHVFELIVYDIFNVSTKATKTRGNDKTPPMITSSLQILSNEKNLKFTTDEPAYCKVGFEENNLVEVSNNYQTNRSVVLPFVEGSNSVFVKCNDEQDNTMTKLVTISFTLDTTAPSTVSNINYLIEENKTKLIWSAATDSSGIESYNIYNSLQLVATSKEASWFVNTNDSVYYISAVDKAGNEGKKEEYNLGRELLLQSDFQATNESDEEEIIAENATEQNVTKEGKGGISKTTITAWTLFVILLCIYIGWKIYEHKKDKHGLRKYLRQRIKLREAQFKR